MELILLSLKCNLLPFVTTFLIILTTYADNEVLFGHVYGRKSAPGGRGTVSNPGSAPAGWAARGKDKSQAKAPRMEVPLW